MFLTVGLRQSDHPFDRSLFEAVVREPAWAITRRRASPDSEWLVMICCYRVGRWNTV